MLSHKFGTYWNHLETYEALKLYMRMNLNGLKDAVVKMLAGENVSINTGTFTNDMTNFSTKDDVLTLLVHLGYLTYDSENETVTIPNKEVSQEYINARKDYRGNLLLAGINYERNTKTHSCVIEKITI